MRRLWIPALLFSLSLLNPSVLLGRTGNWYGSSYHFSQLKKARSSLFFANQPCSQAAYDQVDDFLRNLRATSSLLSGMVCSEWVRITGGWRGELSRGDYWVLQYLERLTHWFEAEKERLARPCSEGMIPQLNVFFRNYCKASENEDLPLPLPFCQGQGAECLRAVDAFESALRWLDTVGHALGRQVVPLTEGLRCIETNRYDEIVEEDRRQRREIRSQYSDSARLTEDEYEALEQAYLVSDHNFVDALERASVPILLEGHDEMRKFLEEGMSRFRKECHFSH